MFKFEIDLFFFIVILVVNGEIVIYDEVMVIIVVNILVFGKGVIVNILKVKVGNVRVKSGVKVIVISCESSNILIVIIYKEEGVELFNLFGNDVFEVVDVVVVDL